MKAIIFLALFALANARFMNNYPRYGADECAEAAQRVQGEYERLAGEFTANRGNTQWGWANEDRLRGMMEQWAFPQSPDFVPEQCLDKVQVCHGKSMKAVGDLFGHMAKSWWMAGAWELDAWKVSMFCRQLIEPCQRKQDLILIEYKKLADVWKANDQDHIRSQVEALMNEVDSDNIPDECNGENEVKVCYHALPQFQTLVKEVNERWNDVNGEHVVFNAFMDECNNKVVNHCDMDNKALHNHYFNLVQHMMNKPEDFIDFEDDLKQMHTDLNHLRQDCPNSAESVMICTMNVEEARGRVLALGEMVAARDYESFNSSLADFCHAPTA